MVESIGEAIAALDAGEFDKFIGTAESPWFEAKEQPYVLKEDKQRLEFAKDVSAMANAGGGLIVLGLATQKSPTEALESVFEIKPFPESLVNQQQLWDILRDWVYPALDWVAVKSYSAGEEGKRKCVVAIIVAGERAAQEGPHVVVRGLGEYGGDGGKLIAFFERKGDRVPPMVPARVQQLLASGQQFQALRSRIESIEAFIARIEGNKAREAQRATLNDFRERERRLAQARAAVEREGQPNLIYTARANEPCGFPRLFESRNDPVVQLLRDPRRLRGNGFNLGSSDDIPEIVRGLSRRSVTAGFDLRELWPDGFLVFVGPGDANFLSWGSDRDSGRLVISALALAEATLHFCMFAKDIFKCADPKPKHISVTIGIENMTVNGSPARFDPMYPAPNGRPFLGLSPREAPAAGHEWTVGEVELASFDEAAVPYQLVAGLCSWFGFDAERLRYADRSGSTPRITGELFR